MRISIGNGRAHFWPEKVQCRLNKSPETECDAQCKSCEKAMCVFAVKRLPFSRHGSIIFFNQVFRSDRGGTKLIIKLASLLLKIKLHTKKSGGTECFTSLVNCFNMAADRIFSFINAEDGLEAQGISNRRTLWYSINA